MRRILLALAMAIAFVGAATASKAGATSGNTTITLASGLTGGIGTAVATGDLVLAVFGTDSAGNRTLAITDGTNPYTLIGAELYANDTEDTNLRCAYKFMGATPDASTTFGPTGNGADAGAMAVYVFRGVDATTPLDVAAVQATALNTLFVVPPDILPITAGAYPVVMGAAGHTGGVDTFTSSDLTDFRTQGSNDSNDVTIGVGHQANWSSGATNFATWGHSQADSTIFSWVATTIALRPAAAAAITGDGDLSAQAAAVDGAGTTGSAGAGALAAQASTMDGAGTSSSTGAGALAAGAASIEGSGEVADTVIMGEGALVAASSSIDGDGITLSVGLGALIAQASELAGAGTAASIGAGALAAQSALVSGEGASGSDGVGDLQAESATIEGYDEAPSVDSGYARRSLLVNVGRLMNQ